MKFLLDENAEFRIAGFLKGQGHDVKTIIYDYTRGMPDVQVLQLARAEGRVLITNDTDFPKLIAREQLPHAGVVLFHLGLAETVQAKIEHLDALLADHADQLHHLIIITPEGLTIRA